MPTANPTKAPREAFAGRNPIAPAKVPVRTAGIQAGQSGSTNSSSQPMMAAIAVEATIRTGSGCGLPGTRVASAQAESAPRTRAPTTAPGQPPAPKAELIAAPPAAPIAPPAIPAPTTWLGVLLGVCKEAKVDRFDEVGEGRV
jgi:hypothetical protein